MKKVTILLCMLSIFLCGCNVRKHETIVIYSRKDMIADNININLKSGYWVEDYDIDYENNVVTLKLYEEEVNN